VAGPHLAGGGGALVLMDEEAATVDLLAPEGFADQVRVPEGRCGGRRGRGGRRAPSAAAAATPGCRCREGRGGARCTPRGRPRARPRLVACYTPPSAAQAIAHGLAHADGGVLPPNVRLIMGEFNAAQALRFGRHHELAGAAIWSEARTSGRLAEIDASLDGDCSS
jgi:hypothetical protein